MQKPAVWKLVVSVILDIIGIFTGGVVDVFYAPLYGAWIQYAYKSTPGMILGFVEEILPFTDVIPTATIIHLYQSYKTKT